MRSSKTFLPLCVGLPWAAVMLLSFCDPFTLALDPKPPVWPVQFHAVILANRSNSLSLLDLYYDWPHKRNLIIIRPQLNKTGTTWDVEWNNGTSYYFSREEKRCRTVTFPVGVLPPNWLDNATYLGRQLSDGINTTAWTKAGFIKYYSDEDTNYPVRWLFLESNADHHVLTFEEGVVAPSLFWQAPEYCFDAEQSRASKPSSGHEVHVRHRRFMHALWRTVFG